MTFYVFKTLSFHDKVTFTIELSKMMSASNPLDEMEDFIREKIEKERWTHKRISLYLEHRFPHTRGLSVRSVTRYAVKQAHTQDFEKGCSFLRC